MYFCDRNVVFGGRERILLKKGVHVRLFDIVINYRHSLLFIFISSLELKVRYCDRWICPSSAMRRRALSTSASKEIPLNKWLDFDQNLAVMIHIFASLTIVQMVPVRCISRSQRLKTDLRDKTFEIFLSETTRPRALISGM